MAASAYNTSVVQYPIWIERNVLYCDEGKLKDHITHKLNYKENDADRIIQQINGHIKYDLYDFWWSAVKNMSTEAVEVLLHSIKHVEYSQPFGMLSYQGGYRQDTALHRCADNKNNEVIKVILDSVSEEECYQLLSIKDNLRWTPLHRSCWEGDTESVRVMLNHINQDMRYSLLQITNNASETPLRSEEHTSELQSPCNLVCRLLLEKKKTTIT